MTWRTEWNTTTRGGFTFIVDVNFIAYNNGMPNLEYSGPFLRGDEDVVTIIFFDKSFAISDLPEFDLPKWIALA